MHSAASTTAPSTSMEKVVVRLGTQSSKPNRNTRAAPTAVLKHVAEEEVDAETMMDEEEADENEDPEEENDRPMEVEEDR